MSGSVAPTPIQLAITQDYENILQRDPDAAGLAGWTAAVTSGALTLLQVEAAIVASPEAQTNVVPIVEMYTVFGRAPDPSGLKDWVKAFEAGESITDVAAGFLGSAEGVAMYGTGAGAGNTDANTAFITTVYHEVLGRLPDTAGQAYWTGLLSAGTMTPAQVLAAIVGSPEATARDATAVTNFLLGAGVGTYAPTLETTTGQTFTLTSGVDKLSLSGNDEVVGTANGPLATFTPGDQIIGVAGSTGNQLDLSDLGTAGTWTPTNVPGVVVSNVQTVYMNTEEAASVNTATSAEGFGGLTNLIVNYDDAGGNANSSITAADTTSVSSEDYATGGHSDTVLGGDDIAFVADGVTTGGAIIIGSTTAAPTGNITATVNDANNTAANTTGSSITTTGGTTVDITQNLVAASAGPGNFTSTGGAITVNGSATTTDVTVVQDAPILAVTGVAGVGGIADGGVTITDANGTSTTKAGTINNVTLTNYGATKITDNALTHLNLSGSGLGVTITDNLTPTSPVTPTTLFLAADGLTDTAGLTDTNNEITTIDITTGGTVASTLGLIADTGLTTLNVAGKQALTLGTTPSTLSTVNVSGGVGLTVALGSSAAFTSTSTGTDVVTISAPATQTIKGNGTANEELVWNGASAPASLAALGSASGFKVLGIGSAVAGTTTFDMSKITGFSGFDVQANSTATLITLGNVNAGSPLAIDGAFTGSLAYDTADTNGATDSLALTLGAATNKTGFTVGGLTLGDAASDGIGTLFLTSNASTSGNSNKITSLIDPGLSSLFVTGTGGLTVSNTLNDTASSLALGGSETGTAGITFTNGISDTSLNKLTVNGSDNVTLGGLTTNAAALNLITNGTPALTVGLLTDGNLTSLTLNGEIAITATTVGTSGNTVTGGADNSNVTLTQTGATISGKTDSITLGNGTNSITDTAAGAGSTVNITVGTGANTVTLGGAATNNVSFGNHSTTTVDSVSVASTGSFVPAAVISGLNAGGADTITFRGDATADTTFTSYSTGQLNGFAAATGTSNPPLTLGDAVSDILSTAVGAGGLLAHTIAAFQFGGNTYLLDDQAGGTAFAIGDTLVELKGSYSLSAGLGHTAVASAGVAAPFTNTLSLHG